MRKLYQIIRILSEGTQTRRGPGGSMS